MSKRKYKHLFFDLDHTLWDFESNSENTLFSLAEKYKFPNVHGDEGFVETYKVVNKKLWLQYENGEIDQHTLRTERFRVSLLGQGISDEGFIKKISEEYLQELPSRKILMEGAHETLECLRKSYNIHLITNGFEDVQHKKIKHAGISHFFDSIITSEKAGCMKPGREIFELALQSNRAEASESLMIGDNHSADIIGAAAVGIDQVWFNPPVEQAHKSATYRITTLRELFVFL